MNKLYYDISKTRLCLYFCFISKDTEYTLFYSDSANHS